GLGLHLRFDNGCIRREDIGIPNSTCCISPFRARIINPPHLTRLVSGSRRVSWSCLGCRVSDPLTAAGTPGRLRRVVVLGSTGSIGVNCLEVINHLSDRLEAVGLSAHSNWQALFEQAKQFLPRWACITNPEIAARLDPAELGATRLLTGPDG